MLYIANIIRDQKFIDGQITYHDLTSDRCVHDYYLINWNKWVEFRYIENKDRVKIITPNELIRLLDKGKYDAIFIHNFLYMPLHYMWRLPKSIKVFWFAWGYDIYNTPRKEPYIGIQLLHPKSKDLLVKLRRWQKPSTYALLKHKIKYLWNLIFNYDRVDHNDNPWIYKKAVSRVDYFSGVFPLEYDLLKDKAEFRAVRVAYEYTNPKDWDNLDKEVRGVGKNILIGNSADINNNHLDLLDYIKNIDINNAKFIVPLSYGGSKLYADYIAKEYSSSLGERCIILKDYMPREQYMELLSSVGVGVFFHERQQATCNIEELLRHGVKVFLSETSVNYKHYKSVGYYIYTLQKDLNQESISTPLTDEQKKHNAMLWYKTSNKEFRLKYLYDIYDIIEKNNEHQSSY